MSQLKQGLIHKDPIPQAHKTKCQFSGKVRWLSQRDAEIAQSKMPGEGSVYYCIHCAFWHLTRQPLRKGG